MKHTPGPWTFDGHSCVDSEAGMIACAIHDVSPELTVFERSHGEAMANLRLIAAAPDLLAANRWYPIETAPKDGRLILVFAPGAKWDLPDLTCCCAWHPDAGFCVCELREPTHWMPLPAPPTKMVQDPAPPLPESER